MEKFRIANPISSRGRYNHFDTSPYDPHVIRMKPLSHEVRTIKMPTYCTETL